MKSQLNRELIAALFPSTVGKHRLSPPQEFMRELDRYGVSYSISDTIYPRVKLAGGNEKELNRCRAILVANPEIEAWLILHEATKDETLLDCIQERACIRWSEGLSDSLYMAVLGNFTATGEIVEYTDKPDYEQVSFARALGIPEAEIMNREKYPSAWIKLKPKTDWKSELEKYR